MGSPIDPLDERLAELAELPPDHPDLLAVRSDPRRWARLVVLREFLHPTIPQEAARTSDAVARLRDAVRRELDSSPTSASDHGVLTRQPGRDPMPLDGARRSVEGAGRRRTWRPLLVAAAIAAAVAIAVVSRWNDPSGTMRGTRTDSIRLEAPSLANERVLLRWSPAIGADAYEVTLLSNSLVEVGPVVRSAVPHIELERSRVQGSDALPAVAFWRVTALRRGVPIQASDTAPFSIR